MGESPRLRLSDVRAVFRLIGECRELGDDPLAWRMRLVERLKKLVGARVAMCGEIVLDGKDYTNPQVALGWEDQQAETWHNYLRAHVGRDDPFWHRVQAAPDCCKPSGDAITCLIMNGTGLGTFRRVGGRPMSTESSSPGECVARTSRRSTV